MSNSDTLVDGQPSSVGAIAPMSHSTASERYELISELGSGGMGCVWLGVDRLLSRDVAVKILHRHHEGSEDVRTRFEREARLTSRLNHPGIVPVHDVGRLPSGELFFAMQRIQGVDLRQHLDSILKVYDSDESDTIQEYPLQALLRLFSQACMILAYAHDRGYVHRDLKPANILVGKYGELYVADWGIAKLNSLNIQDSTTHASGVQPDDLTDESRPGVLIGTVKYMSPEQVMPESHTLTAKSDIFSLGIMLYELVTGKEAFRGASFLAVMRNIVEGNRPTPEAMPDGRAIPVPLLELFDSTMDLDPDKRPTAKELATLVDRFVDGVEDRIRAAQRAAEYLDEGRASIRFYKEQKKDTADKRQALEFSEGKLRENSPLSMEVATGEALNPYLELWQTNRELQQANLEVEQTYTKAVRALNRSIEYQDNESSHTLLADLYWDKYVEAKASHDRATAFFFRALVVEHDRGKYQGLLADNGSISLAISNQNGDVRPLADVQAEFSITMERYVETGPLLLPEGVDWTAPMHPVGSYRLRLTQEGGLSFNVPILVTSNEDTLVDLTIPEANLDDFILITGGSSIMGGDADAPNGSPATEVALASFWMAQNPVTVGHYVDFLNDIAKSDVDRARHHAPRSPSGVRYIEYDENEAAFVIPKSDSDGDAWDPLWPITMVNQVDALAYCKWKSDADGRAYRLPTEFEWEYAARGVDGRIYPWGNGYDRLISCSSRGMNNDKTTDGERNGPARIDEFPYDVSPFGVRHLGGLAMEWTSTVNYADNVVMKGGGLFSTAAWCRAATRTAHAATHLGVQFGFRLAADF